ncbi:hypothetical protein [Candidatus Nitrosotalea sp. TS]|uniref:hypothetical protein n=1 Tax=Candidatus Nitrosotalea sp. TS TaxID=2341020 RepID=UPI00140C2AAB|nr:hypothetical protein [Candidatus Nitrosotalea sp. TS]
MSTLEITQMTFQNMWTFSIPVYADLKTKHPNVKFGNWFSLNDLINHSDSDMVKKLNPR